MKSSYGQRSTQHATVLQHLEVSSEITDPQYFPMFRSAFYLAQSHDHDNDNVARKTFYRHERLSSDNPQLVAYKYVFDCCGNGTLSLLKCCLVS